MSEEEIKALAAELGLDPERITLFEPCAWPNQWVRPSRRYRFEYNTGENVLDFNFVLGADYIEAGYEAFGVEFYVNKGLREMAAKINA